MRVLPPALSSPGAAIIKAQSVPSGTGMELYEVLIDKVGEEDWLRFRFIAPGISKDLGGVTYSDVVDDFEYLCREIALPYLADYDLAADVVVVSLLDRPVAFGQSAPEATQFFEAFRIADGACAWDQF